MRANRAQNTGPERRLREALRAAGLGGYRLNWRKAPGRPDIAYPGRKLAIFLHGCYWHHCPRCYPNLPKSNPEFWARKFELNRERDARKRARLEAIGWSVIETWEHELTDLTIVVARVIRVGWNSTAIPHPRPRPSVGAAEGPFPPAASLKTNEE
jgi:DNA mismatch endonuclease Vsr